MNEHKYLNTLANVNQVRLKLKQTQDSYNEMASNLQASLNDKQEKCNELRKWFKDFKREIAKGAEFNRTGKRIPDRLIVDWEDKENVKDQEVY
jgi:hypothetical protein